MLGKENSKGFFVTITAFLLAMLLLSLTIGLQEVRNAEEESANFLIATEQASFKRESILRMTEEVYKNTANIQWEIRGNDFIFTESFPTIAGKGKLLQNLSDVNYFFNNYFPKDFNYHYNDIDLGNIQVYEKDFAVHHSLSSGFSTNERIYFIADSIKYNTVEMDVNVNTAFNPSGVDNRLTTCSGCSNGIRLIMTLRDEVRNEDFTYDGQIDLDLTNEVAIDVGLIPGAADDILFSFTSTGYQAYSDEAVIDMIATTTFDDTVIAAGLDRSILEIGTADWYSITG